jgi:hypothetical protein
MEKITEFRNTLAVPIHKLSIDSLVQEVCLCPEYFEDIYRLTYDEKQTVSWRAIWVCEKLSEIHPDWFILLYDEIIQRLIDCTTVPNVSYYLYCIIFPSLLQSPSIC